MHVYLYSTVLPFMGVVFTLFVVAKGVVLVCRRFYSRDEANAFCEGVTDGKIEPYIDSIVPNDNYR